MTDEGAGEKGHADFRHGVISILPGSAVEGVHVFTLAANHAQRHAAADHLAIGHKVGFDAEEGLGAAGTRAEPQHHFIKNQCGARPAGDDAELLHEVDGHHIGAARHHRLHQHTSNVLTKPLEDFQRLRVVIFQHQDAGLGSVRDAGGDGNGAQLTVSHQWPRQNFIKNPMIAAGEHGYNIPPANSAAGSDSGHEGFRPRVAKGNAFLTRELPNQMSHFARQRRGRADFKAFVDLLMQGVSHEFRTVAKEPQTKAVNDIDPAVAVRVPEVSALAAVRHSREDHVLP